MGGGAQHPLDRRTPRRHATWPLTLRCALINTTKTTFQTDAFSGGVNNTLGFFGPARGGATFGLRAPGKEPPFRPATGALRDGMAWELEVGAGRQSRELGITQPGSYLAGVAGQ